MKKSVAVLFASLFTLAAVSAQAANPIYPFKVKLNGQEAAPQSDTAIFALVSKPVPANATIEVDAQGQVIINAVKCDANGTPVQGGAMAVIMFEAPKGSLDKTMDGKKLEPGKYLANVVAGQSTSRIVFDVQ